MATPANVSKLAGTGYQQITMPRLSPEQQQLFSQVFSGIQPGLGAGLSQLSQQAAGGSPEFWQQLEAPALRQFGELQSQLASRFSGMGTGARRSSGFQNLGSSAARELAENLQAQRLGLQRSAISELNSLYGQLMGQDIYNQALIPKQKKRPFWQELLGSFAPGIGQGLGTAGSLAFMGV